MAGGWANSAATMRFNFGYNAGGQIESLRRYADAAGTNSVANTFYDYDPLGRLKTMVHTTATTSPLPLSSGQWGSGILAGYKYTYDAASRIDSLTSYVDGLTSYAYDNTNQLTGADHPVGQSDEGYSYDANGNRMGGGYATGLNNQMSSDGTYTYLYDAEGNRIRKTKIATGIYTQYFYDHRNRLIGVEDVDPTQISGTGHGTAWGWGESSQSGSFDLYNGDPEGTENWGWGSSTGGATVPGEYNGEEYSDTFSVSVASATEGGDIVLTFHTSYGSPGNFCGNPACNAGALEYWIEDVSATSGNDFTNNAATWQYVYTDDSGYGTLSIPTTDDAILEFTESLKIHVRTYFNQLAECEVEADILDNDLTSGTVHYTAAAPAVIEGEVLTLTADADVAVDFEYYVEDRSANLGTNYTDPNNSSSTNWKPVGATWQIAFPTLHDPTHIGTLSFAIHVRVVGYSTTEIVLDADIYDFDETIVQTVDYAYDAYNRLVKRTIDTDGPAGYLAATNTFYVWESGQIVFQFEGGTSTTPAHRYLFNPLAVDQILADEIAAYEVLWPLTDHLGTARDIAYQGSTTTIFNHRTFDSYGKLLFQTSTPFSIAFGFTGAILDNATGLQYNRNRWYDPETGRWVSEDPMGFAAGDTNLSRYVKNQPTMLTDPTGLEPPNVWAAGAYGAGQGTLTGAMTVGQYLTYPARWVPLPNGFGGWYYWNPSGGDELVDHLWKTGLNRADKTTRPCTEFAAKTAAVSAYGAAGAGAYSASGLPTFGVAVGPGTGATGTHVTFGVSQGGAPMVWGHSVGGTGFIYPAGSEFVTGAWFTLEGIPIAAPGAVLAMNRASENCAGAAGQAFATGIVGQRVPGVIYTPGAPWNK